jgi:hypothetical protein
VNVLVLDALSRAMQKDHCGARALLWRCRTNIFVPGALSRAIQKEHLRARGIIKSATATDDEYSVDMRCPTGEDLVRSIGVVVKSRKPQCGGPFALAGYYEKWASCDQPFFSVPSF